VEHRTVLTLVGASRGRRFLLLAGALIATIVGLAASGPGAAQAQVFKTEALPDGVQRTTYRVGPLNVTSGQNRISFAPITGGDRPAVDGWITRIKPDLTNEDGTIPKSSRVMFHHGVWMNMSAPGDRQLFYATGEEKTILDLPDGYGYRYRQSDSWLLNHMIHNLVPDPMKLYITYTVDFIPDGSPAAEGITEARPIWMDVQSGIYPVFDVLRDSGGADGEFTYPQDATDPYPANWQKNEKTITKDGVLVWTTGHVHTGGLSTNLYLKRNGASYAGGTCPPAADLSGRIGKLAKKQAKLKRRAKAARKQVQAAGKRRRSPRRGAPASRAGTNRLARAHQRKRKGLARINRQKRANAKQLKKVRAKQKAANAAYQRCVDSKPQVDGNRVHLFESGAKYFDPRGPISWDMAMYSTPEDWRVQVKKGDTLELQTTYETERASWYESMGINVVYIAEDQPGGDDPYATKVDREGVLNHGHYPENEDYGGENPTVGPDPATLADGLTSGGPFTIGGYTYSAGGFNLPGANGRPPVVKKGQTFTFEMAQSDLNKEIWHSLTSCKSPCNKSTGISYPIPDGEFQFDSGQLGDGGEPTVGRTTWTTPSNLPVGTHTFFCRIHPLMRGAIRVKP